MRRMFPVAFAAVASVLVLMGSVAQAATAQRTFVASNGNDANACSLVAPCRSFGVAITHTSAGGEVIVLDSAGYGPVTIGKGVSIIAPDGVYAGVSVASGDGITVDAPGGIVRLRGLSINSLGSSGNAITDVAAAELDVEHCWMTGFGKPDGSGIVVLTNVDSSRLTVIDSTLSDNEFGMRISPTAGTPYISVEGTRFTGHNLTVGVFGPTRATIHASQLISSKLATNGGGIRILPFVPGPVEFHIDDTVIDGADRGVDADLGSASYVSVSMVHATVTHAVIGLFVGGATAAVADSRFTHNDTAIFVSAGSTLFTGGTTYMAYNGAYVTGPGTIDPPAGNF